MNRQRKWKCGEVEHERERERDSEGGGCGRQDVNINMAIREIAKFQTNHKVAAHPTKVFMSQTFVRHHHHPRRDSRVHNCSSR